MDQDSIIFVTVFPASDDSISEVSQALETGNLPTAEQTHFSGAAAIETAVKWSQAGVSELLKILRALVKADKIDKIELEANGKKVSLTGIPKDELENVDAVAQRLLDRLKDD